MSVVTWTAYSPARCPGGRAVGVTEAEPMTGWRELSATVPGLPIRVTLDPAVGPPDAVLARVFRSSGRSWVPSEVVWEGYVGRNNARTLGNATRAILRAALGFRTGVLPPPGLPSEDLFALVALATAEMETEGSP